MGFFVLRYPVLRYQFSRMDGTGRSYDNTLSGFSQAGNFGFFLKSNTPSSRLGSCHSTDGGV
jgi:hypothetical protein